MKTLASSGLVPELRNALSDPDFRMQCDACAIGKAKATPFSDSCDRAVEKLQLVHSDLLTINVPSLRGMRYILTFVDDFSRKLWVYPLATKSETFDRFKAFKAMVELESGCKLKALRSDNGGEYLSTAFKHFVNADGMRHDLTIPHTPQQNGVAERVNRTIVEALITMLHESGLPTSLWAEAAMHFASTKNLLPHAALKGDVPARVWSGKSPSHLALHPFGCAAFARDTSPHRTARNWIRRPDISSLSGTIHDLKLGAYGTRRPHHATTLSYHGMSLLWTIDSLFERHRHLAGDSLQETPCLLYVLNLRLQLLPLTIC
jgi:transposase InsO family protein